MRRGQHIGTALPHLAFWRVARGLTQRGLAVEAGMTQTAIVYLETGRRYARPATITKLAAALNMAPEQLIDGRKPRSTKKQARDCNPAPAPPR